MGVRSLTQTEAIQAKNSIMPRGIVSVRRMVPPARCWGLRRVYRKPFRRSHFVVAVGLARTKAWSGGTLVPCGGEKGRALPSEDVEVLAITGIRRRSVTEPRRAFVASKE
jgi:hypothetical protein